MFFLVKIIWRPGPAGLRAGYATGSQCCKNTILFLWEDFYTRTLRLSNDKIWGHNENIPQAEKNKGALISISFENWMENHCYKYWKRVAQFYKVWKALECINLI